VVARWCAEGRAATGQQTLGEPWVWATRKGLEACGLNTKLVRPMEKRLRHTHAVTDVRLAVERTSAYRQARGSWRAERFIRDRQYPGQTVHVPDGEVRWSADTGAPWAGETWAVEVELTRKTVQRLISIMQVALSQPPGYARLVYACSPESVRAVLAARAELDAPLASRIDVHNLPKSAMRLNTSKREVEP